MLNEFNDLLLTESHGDGERHVRGYIGIAVAPRDGDTVAELLDCVCKRVDAAIRSGTRVVAADLEERASGGLEEFDGAIGLVGSLSL